MAVPNIAPTAAHRRRRWFHGTPVEQYAKKILRSGEIRPREMTKVLRHTKAKLDPQRGKVYITPSLEQALEYALARRLDLPAVGKWGYVFEIAGAELVDIEPDEDAVGYLAFCSVSGHCSDLLDDGAALWKNDPIRTSLAAFAVQHATPAQRELLQHYGPTLKQAAALGKRLLQRGLPDDVRRWITEQQGVAVAHSGPVPIVAVSRFPHAAGEWEIRKAPARYAEPVKGYRPIAKGVLRRAGWGTAKDELLAI